MNNSFEKNNPNEVLQYNLGQIFLLFTWPILWFMLLIYGIGPLFVQADGTVSTWVVIIISILGNGAELVAALVIFKKEGYKLTFSSLKERIHWRWPKNWKLWLAFLGMFVAAFVLSSVLSSTVKPIAEISNIPDWMPGHPLKEVNSIQDVYPDINFKGNILFFIVQNFIVVIVCNMFGEELYYRAALQPKMKAVFGKWNWVAAGIGFALKHLYFWWRIPMLIPAGLGFAFIFGPVGSLPLSIISHWIGNMAPMNLYFNFMALIGIG